VQFVAALLALPLKDPKRKRETITEQQLHDSLCTLFGYVFLANDEIAGFSLKASATDAYKTLSGLVRSHVAAISRGGKIKSWADSAEQQGYLKSYGNNLIRRLLKAGKAVDEVTKDIISIATVATANNIQQVSHFRSLN
jgi:hypothetical protein